MKKEQLNRKKSKKSVGGFFATLLILIILGAAAFCFGWIQLRLSEDEYAVVYRKSYGYEERVIGDEEFVWRWEALLPTYLTLHKFILKPQTTNIRLSDTLPSGKIYNAIVGDSIDFDWEIDARISYRVNPDSLSSLVESGSYDLDSFYSDFEAKLNSAVLDIVNQVMVADPNEVEAGRQDWLSESIKNRAIDERVDIVEVSITKWKYPDLALYAEARRLTLKTMQERQAVISEIENLAANLESTQEVRLKLLKGYAQVLDEYPILIDFFELEGVPIETILPTVIE